jgi:hypothetical protein
MDDDDAKEKNTHIRITIPSDGINDTEERDTVKGFDYETVVEIKFFQKDDDTVRVQIQPTKRAVNHWQQYLTRAAMKDNWIQNGTIIVHQNPEIAVAE